MAKIFSNIAKNTNNLSNRYSDSTVNNNLTTFTALRNVSDVTLGDFNKVEIRRIEDVYELYTKTPSNLQPQTYTYSELLTPVVYTRKRSTKFYKGFPLVNPTLTLSNAPTNNTLVEIYPDQKTANSSQTYVVDRSLMLQDSQALPIVSGPRDVSRINQYLLSGEGIRFIGFQKIIQRGNTFGQTRQYNVTSVPQMTLNYANANLFDNALERVSRITLTDTTIDPNLAGRIQKESVITAQNKLRLKYVGGAYRPTPPSPAQNYVDSFLRNRVLNQPIPVPGVFTRGVSWLNSRFGTNFSLGNTTTLGQIGNGLSALSQFGQSLSTDINNQTLNRDQTAYDQLYVRGLWPLMKQPYGGEGGSSVIRSFENEKAAYIQRARTAITGSFNNINNANPNTRQYPEDNYRSSADYTDSVQTNSQKRTWAGITTATYLKDSFNFVDNKSVTDVKKFDQVSTNLALAGVDGPKDYIRFVVKVPGLFDGGIYFRAFISDLNHSTNGEYESIRYVGRPERFVTYRGMSRGLTFSMYLVAFSKDELDGMWARANMLNKLMYPVDNSGGYMTPPLAKITLGNVLVDQPGYVETVDMRFTDIPWDIDRELPQAIQLNMKYNIIEDAYITQNNTSAAFAQLFNRMAYPKAPPVTEGPQPPGSAPTSAETATSPQAAARSLVSVTPQLATRLATVTPSAPADATRVALPNRPISTPYLSETQKFFGISPASVALSNAVSRLRIPTSVTPTIGPRR